MCLPLSAEVDTQRGAGVSQAGGAFDRDVPPPSNLRYLFPWHGQLGREFPRRWFATELNKRSARGPHHLVGPEYVWRDRCHVFYLLRQVGDSYRGLHELGSLDTAPPPLPRTESA